MTANVSGVAVLIINYPMLNLKYKSDYLTSRPYCCNIFIFCAAERLPRHEAKSKILNMIALIIIGIALFIFGICELTDWLTYGGFLKEEKADKLAEKLNQKCFTSKGIIHWTHYDFASKKSGFLSRWYIHKNGDQKRIFIGSKMNKMLNEKYKELRIKELQNTNKYRWYVAQ